MQHLVYGSLLLMQIKILEDRLAPLKKGVSTISLKDYEAVNKVRQIPLLSVFLFSARLPMYRGKRPTACLLQILCKYVEAWQKRKRIFNDVWCGFRLSACA